MVSIVQKNDGTVRWQDGEHNDLIMLGGTSVKYKAVMTAQITLADADTGGGVFAWANPHSEDIVVEGVYLDITTVATGACTLDVGTTPTSATTVSDNLIDGIDVNSATGLFDNSDNSGTNGKFSQRLASGKWVTGSKKTGAAADIAGEAFVKYFMI